MSGPEKILAVIVGVSGSAAMSGVVWLYFAWYLVPLGSPQPGIVVIFAGLALIRMCLTSGLAHEEGTMKILRRLHSQPEPSEAESVWVRCSRPVLEALVALVLVWLLSHLA